MTQKGRTIVTVGARTLTGLLGLAVAVAVIGAATLLPLPSYSITAPGVTVQPRAASQVRVCPGPALALGEGSGDASQAVAIGNPTELFGAGDLPVQSHRLASDLSTQNSAQAPLALEASALAGTHDRPLLAAAQTQVVSSADTAGFVASACTEPSTDTWLVGGSTTLGQTTLVLLSNPSAVDATVNLTIYTQDGEVNGPGSAGVDVPAGTQKVVPLSGLAPNAAATVVRVTSTGGDIAAALEQSYEQGIQPQGIDIVGPTAKPADVQRISGVVLSSLAAISAEQTGEGTGVSVPAVRILVPGKKQATVSVGVVGEGGTTGGTVYAQRIQPGTVAEVPLQGLHDGTYTITVRSNVPVVAAVRSTVIGTAHRDFGWFVASQPLDASQRVAVPDGPSPVLHLTNSSNHAVHIALTVPSGGQNEIEIGAGSAVTVPVTSGIYTLGDSRGIYASVSYLGDGEIAAFALNPPGALSSAIRVYPH